MGRSRGSALQSIGVNPRARSVFHRPYQLFRHKLRSLLKFIKFTSAGIMAKYDVEIKDFQSIFSLEGKVAVVTGGSRGLGLHAASGLIQAGCSKVYITSRKPDACDEACRILNSSPGKRPKAQAISVPADGSKVSEIERLVAEVKKTTDHVDILIANAGATWGAPFEDHDDKAFSKVLDLNVKSVFFTVQK